jgi:exonuclease III
LRLRGTWTLKSPNQVLPDVNVRSLLNLKNFPKITLATQNCNSLNVSTVCDKQLKKISAICALETDIILLCDIRLNSARKEVEKIEKLFLYNKSKQYDFYFNSSKNSRGVGILISHHLNYSISKTLKDDKENILGLSINLDGFPLRIFSVYGPNDNCRDFFDKITNFLDDDPSSPVIPPRGGLECYLVMW